jgi:cysteine desulfurase
VRDLARRLEEHGHAQVAWLEHDAQGRVRVEHLRGLLAERASEIAVVSVMAANNETGVVQPVTELAHACREAGVSFHTDATQWVGKRPTRMHELGADLLSCSAHKLHGPKGVGALAIRRGTPLEAVLAGGPQERERRAGTENVPGIAGFAAAAEVTLAWLEGPGQDQGAALRDLLEQLVRAAQPDAVVNACGAERLWNTTNMGFPSLEAEAILLALSERGLNASAGAACSSGSLEPSPVLLAMGVPERVAHGSVRFSLGRGTTEAHVRQAAKVIEQAVTAVRGASAHALH